MVPQVSGVGGMVSFRAKFTAGLQARGIEVTPDPKLSTPDALLVIGGTRDLPGLWRARRRGLRIVQRLNGYGPDNGTAIIAAISTLFLGGFKPG